MGAVEETRKALQDFLAPEIRTLTAEIRSLGEQQALLRTEVAVFESRSRTELGGVEERLGSNINRVEERLSSSISGVEARTRTEILASEARVTAAIDRIRQDLPPLVRNAVLE